MNLTAGHLWAEKKSDAAPLEP